jgi:tRNA1Val (adenine37-N6)-methyltransferase
MGKNSYFRFKQFMVIQEKSAMKVGTDGVLLGAWVIINSAKTILDVGTGTGVIALMMAQRSVAEITALEIEKESFGEACFNFNQSPWSGRIYSVHQSFQAYSAETLQKFDLIISNPPFFENASKSSELSRSNARHNDLLPFSELIGGCDRLLTTSGRFALILPAEQSERFISLASDFGLFVTRLTKVRPKPGKSFHRYLLEFSKVQTEVVSDELTIEFDVHNNFTTEYINLTKDFYLLF